MCLSAKSYFTNPESKQDEWKQRFKSFDSTKEMMKQPNWNRLTLEGQDQEFLVDFNKVLNDITIQEADDSHDNYLGMEVCLPRGPDDSVLRVMVRKRSVDVEGKPIGKISNNPFLDTRKYEVEYGD